MRPRLPTRSVRIAVTSNWRTLRIMRKPLMSGTSVDRSVILVSFQIACEATPTRSILSAKFTLKMVEIAHDWSFSQLNSHLPTERASGSERSRNTSPAVILLVPSWP